MLTYSSRLDQIERFHAYITADQPYVTTDLFCRSDLALEADIRA
jgi:hypothetical protein